jgi:hypothetical protein
MRAACHRLGTERGPRNGDDGCALVTEMKKREKTEETESLTTKDSASQTTNRLTGGDPFTPRATAGWDLKVGCVLGRQFQSWD